jgi:hypothetical protein
LSPDEGQFSSNLSLSSTTSDEFDEEEVQQAMMSLQHFLHPPMAPDGLSNTTDGGPAARSHADAVPVVQQGTSTTAGLCASISFSYSFFTKVYKVRVIC